MPDWRTSIDEKTGVKSYKYMGTLVDIFRKYFKQIDTEIFIIGGG